MLNLLKDFLDKYILENHLQRKGMMIQHLHRIDKNVWSCEFFFGKPINNRFQNGVIDLFVGKLDKPILRAVCLFNNRFPINC